MWKRFCGQSSLRRRCLAVSTQRHRARQLRAEGAATQQELEHKKRGATEMFLIFELLLCRDWPLRGHEVDAHGALLRDPRRKTSDHSISLCVSVSLCPCVGASVSISAGAVLACACR